MRSPIIFCLLLIVALTRASAQDQIAVFNAPKTKKGPGIFYFGMGFHRVFFTRSDIRFRDTRTANYDFILHKVKAKDDNDLSFGEGIDAPQYSYRLGVYFKKRSDIGIEFNFDHVKYIAVANQKLRVSGQINGTKIDKDTLLSPAFIEYEHTDGANYYLFNFLKRKTLAESRNEKHKLDLVLKPGIGFVLPRTDATVMGYNRNDKYHLAGYVVALDGGLRYEFFKNFYLEAGAKGAFANYRDILLHREGRARQHWWSLQIIALAGFQFPI